MSKIKVGDAMAYIKKSPADKANYYRVGALYKDSENGSLSLKIDTLPLSGSAWEGWINIFEERTKPEPSLKKPDGSMKTTQEVAKEMDDDIPF